MKVAVLDSNITADITSLKALTPSHNDRVYVESLDAVYYFYTNHATGDYEADDNSGWWEKDTAWYSDFWEAVPDGYDFAGNSKTEVSDIVLFDKYGEHKLGYKRTRDLIKVIVYTDTAAYTTWGSYTHKEIACDWFAAPYALRVPAYHTDDEDWDLWQPLTVKTMEGRAEIVELMRECVSNELRKETMTKANMDTFWEATEHYFNEYIDTNGANFKSWLCNLAPYTTTGFEQETYHTQALEDALMNIYNGIY